MSITLLLSTLGYFLLFLIASYGLGSLVNARVKINLMQIGVRVMIGLGLIGNIGLGMALLGVFEKTNLLLILMIIVVVSIKKLSELVRYLLTNLSSVWKICKTDLLASAGLVLGVMMAGTLYLSAMAPPHATDELHYHFPQARAVAESGRVGHSWDGHYFYGNIPKLGEVFFAEGLLLSGYSLAHAINYLMLVGFLILVFGMIRDKYGYRAAVFSTLLLLLFDDLTWNATVGFVDSATSVTEVGALMMVAWWIKKRDDHLLISAGLLLGTALGIKYSPLPTALYLTIIILVTNWRKILLFGIPAFLMGGYWYVKNWILLGNPFYPMYFGHRGVSEESYRGLMNAIWQWEPKTLKTFMNKLKRWLTYSGSTTYISIWLAPLILFVKKKDSFILTLTGYYLLFIPYWFFLATHQTRFLLTGLVVASILTGIFLARLTERWVLIMLAGIALIGYLILPSKVMTITKNYLNTKLHVTQRQYALGNISHNEFLLRKFGCQYSVVRYLEDNLLLGDVIDNWSVWHDPSVAYFSESNKFQVLTVEDEDFSELMITMNDRNIRYLYLNTETKNRYLANNNPTVIKTKQRKIFVDNILLKNADLLFQDGACKLYKISQ